MKRELKVIQDITSDGGFCNPKTFCLLVTDLDENNQTETFPMND